MTDEQLLEKIRYIKERKQTIKIHEKWLAEAENAVKSEMEARQMPLLYVDVFTVKYQEITKNGIDSKKLKAEMPQIAQMYNKETKYKRLTIT